MAPPISCLFENDYTNFIAIKLHDTYTVIDANSLYNEICRRQLAYGYGLDFLQVSITFRNAINLLKSCKIRPIFIFHGINKFTVSFSSFMNYI